VNVNHLVLTDLSSPAARTYRVALPTSAHAAVSVTAAIELSAFKSRLDGPVTVDEPVSAGSVALGTVSVFQDRQVGGKRRNDFVVSVDGRRVGVAPVRGQLVVKVSPGAHTLRVRGWWYRSPKIIVTVAEGATVRMRADIPRQLGFIRGMARLMFNPSNSLTLTRVDR
jgi:hypothetical protein